MARKNVSVILKIIILFNVSYLFSQISGNSSISNSFTEKRNEHSITEYLKKTKKLKQTPSVLNYKAQLYMLNTEYDNARAIFSKLYRYNKDPMNLFYTALAETLNNNPQNAELTWQTYFRIPEKQRSGKRWDRYGHLLKAITANNAITNESHFMNKTVRSLFLGKGYPLTIYFLRIYEKYGKETYHNTAILKKAESFYRAGFYHEALSIYNKILEEHHSETFYQAAFWAAKAAYRSKLYRKCEDFLAMVPEPKRHYHWYLTAAKTSEKLNKLSQKKAYLKRAAQMSGS